MSEQHGFRITIEIIEQGSYEDSFQAAMRVADRIYDEIVESASILVTDTGEGLLGGTEGVFCEGCEGHVFPGIRWPTSCNDDDSREWVERCDKCERYESDEDAAMALCDIYDENVKEYGKAKPVGLNTLHPYLSTD